MTVVGLIEYQDRWVVPISDVAVTRCCIDFAVNVQCANGFCVRIEQPFVFVDAHGREQLLIPEGDPVALAPILAISRLVVKECAAFKDGHLELHFVDGSQISVPATEDLEPWQVTGDDGLSIVSVPGGELAVWGSTAD